MKHILLAILLVLAFAVPAHAENSFDVRGRIVTIHPEFLLKERARGIKGAFPSNGCGYRIDWGDDHSDPQPYFPSDVHCKSGLRHEYVRPGLYTVRILLISHRNNQAIERELSRADIRTW